MNGSSHTRTLVLAGIAAYLVTKKYFATALALLVPVLLIYFVVGLIALIRRPQERRMRAIRMLVWLLVLLAGGFMQGHWASAARRDADDAVRAVQAFKSRTGTYPQTLADVQMDADALSDRWMLSYRLVDGKPMLDYESTLMPLTVEAFDFEAGKWSRDSY